MSSILFLVFTVFALVAAAPVPAPELAKRCNVPPPNIAIRNQIVSIALSLDVTDKVMLAMMETAMQESDINNLDCGDKDSVGVYQQRPSQGWGSVAQCMDVDFATRSYLRVAIPADKAHPGVSAGSLAQIVQNAEAGNKYDQHESQALQFIAEAKAALGKSGGSSSSSSSSSSAAAAVNVESAPKAGSSSSSTPKTGSGTTSTTSSSTGACKKTYKPVPGNICLEVVKMFDITLTQFYAWNPSINHQCTNMLAGVAYCVAK